MSYVLSLWRGSSHNDTEFVTDGNVHFRTADPQEAYKVARRDFLAMSETDSSLHTIMVFFDKSGTEEDVRKLFSPDDKCLRLVVSFPLGRELGLSVNCHNGFGELIILQEVDVWP